MSTQPEIKPTLEMLIDALEAQMPPRFKWAFRILLIRGGKCDSMGCAIGLAHFLWKNASGDSEMAKSFDIPLEHIDPLFYDPEIHGVSHDDWDAVTPQMVATTLRRIANGRQLPLPPLETHE